MKKYDVVALGELLIDFTQNGFSSQGNGLFEANPGGAPCNVLAMLCKFNKKTAFIGKVGNDQFGRILKDTLLKIGINTEGLVMDPYIPTTLAFVHNLTNGDREFSFYRKPGADMMLLGEDLNADLISDTSIFHFGTLSMTHPNIRRATKKAVSIAKGKGTLISFDPNIRESLWNSLDEAAEQVSFGLGQCDILKISDNELMWFTHKKSYAEGILELRNQYNIPLILLSLGADGSRAYYKDITVKVEAFLQETTIDTTGAGDTFLGCVLNYVLEKGLDDLSEKEILEMLNNANAGASIITTRRGALNVMPSKSEISELIYRQNING